MQNKFRSIGNWFMLRLLRSPIHGLVSGSMAAITVRGARSGRWYHVPVNYQRQADTIWVTSYKYRTWWKNLRGGAQVKIRIQGIEFEGQAVVHETPGEVGEGLRTYFHLAPQMARYFSVKLDEKGEPDPSDMQRIIPGRVVVEIKLQ